MLKKKCYSMIFEKFRALVRFEILNSKKEKNKNKILDKKSNYEDDKICVKNH
jgi:hypothetical protein